VEQDFYSQESISDFEYAIGSVHYIKQDGHFLSVDEGADITKKDIQEIFGGDPYAFAKVYFETVADVLRKTKADIIGHFDLLTKFNENSIFFETKDRRYQEYGVGAIAALIPYGKPFEINTGAIYRGLRSEAYPSIDFLKEIKIRGGKILLSSDSHDGNSLGYYFHEIAKLALEIGFQSVLVWTPQGFEEVGLK
jgi:histidinol-phosphatase (PHP family)